MLSDLLNKIFILLLYTSQITLKFLGLKPNPIFLLKTNSIKLYNSIIFTTFNYVKMHN